MLNTLFFDFCRNFVLPHKNRILMIDQRQTTQKRFSPMKKLVIICYFTDEPYHPKKQFLKGCVGQTRNNRKQGGCSFNSSPSSASELCNMRQQCLEAIVQYTDLGARAHARAYSTGYLYPVSLRPKVHAAQTSFSSRKHGEKA